MIKQSQMQRPMIFRLVLLTAALGLAALALVACGDDGGSDDSGASGGSSSNGSGGAAADQGGNGGDDAVGAGGAGATALSTLMVGQWETDFDETDSRPLNVFDFRADGTFYVSDSETTTPDQLAGTWQVEGNTLTLNWALGGTPTTEVYTAEVGDDGDAITLVPDSSSALPIPLVRRD
jgi:uncharacterized protein (TIGR03066 family)